MKSKVCIIVPFRDREKHLEVFAPKMTEYLKKTNVDGDILVIEQEPGKPFNRAKLLNVGFHYATQSDTYTHFCFHDVDMIPVESDYEYCDTPTHLAAKAQQFNYNLPYETYFGGVTIFDAVSFRKINGYSNEYWGWGAEDDDVFNRCRLLKIPTKRKMGVYESLQHERVIPQNLYQNNVKRLNDMGSLFDGEKMKEGLSTLEFELLSVQATDEYVKIKVKI